MKLGKLILRKRLGREKIQRATIRTFKKGVQDWQVVAKRLSRGGRRDDDYVLAGVDRFGSGSLVAVELANAFAGVRCPQIAMGPGREVHPLRFARREVANRGKDFAVNVASSEQIEHLMHASDRR